MRDKIYLMLVIILLASCIQNDTNKVEPVERKGLGAFDITSDDRFIIFTFSKNSKSSLYKYDLIRKTAILLVKLEKNISIFNPKCSPDGKKIIFIANEKNSLKSSVWMANIDGSGLKKLIDATALITEATFSKRGDIVYYCAAKEYKSYSPVASKNAHDFDIYSINIKNQGIHKLSNLNAYGIKNINDVDSTKLLIQLTAQGVFFYKKGTKANLSPLLSNYIKNIDPKSYSSPVLISKSLIGLISYYELVLFDLNEMKQKVLFSTKGSSEFMNLCNYKIQKKLLFTLTSDTNSFYSIDFIGGNPERIQINIKD